MQFSYLLAVLLGLADLLSHGIHLLQESIHLLLFVPELTGHTLFGGAKLGQSLRQLGELLQGQLPLRVRLLELLCLTPQTLQRLRQLLLKQKNRWAQRTGDTDGDTVLGSSSQPIADLREQKEK